MSRGIDTIETVLPTGSSEATIIVSVRAVLRPTPESTPISRTVMRGWARGRAGRRRAGRRRARGRVRRVEGLERDRRERRVLVDPVVPDGRAEHGLVRLLQLLGVGREADLGQDHERGQEGDRQGVARAQPGEPAIHEHGTDGDDPQGEHDELQDQDRADDVGIGERRGDREDVPGDEQVREQHEADGHRHEERQRAAPPADRDVAESGHERRQDGGAVPGAGGRAGGGAPNRGAWRVVVELHRG